MTFHYKFLTIQAEEEVRDLQKKMQQLENDLDQTQEKLMNANQRLEEKEKALQNVSGQVSSINLGFFFLFHTCLLDLACDHWD